MVSSRPDKLQAVVSAVSACRYRQALNELNNIDLSALDRRDYGRALALELACLDGQGQVDRSAMRLQTLLTRLGPDRRTLLGMGLQLSELQVAHLAERVLRRLGRLDRRRPLPRFYLARLLDKAGRLRDAVREYDRVIARDGAFPPAYVLKAHCLRRLGDLPEAIVTLRWYLRLEPCDARGWMSLGDMLVEQREDRRALVAYQQAETLDPHQPAVALRRVLLAYHRRDEAALQDGLWCLEALVPSQWQAAHAAGLLAELRGRVWQAMDHYLEAVELAFQSDEEDRALTISRALVFSVESDCRNRALDLIRRVRQEQFFPAPVLSALNQWYGMPLVEAREYFILMDHAYDGPTPNLPLVEEIDPAASPPFHGPYRALRSLHVWARDRHEAAGLALTFEKSSQAHDSRILQVFKRRGLSLQHLGVVWRSETLLLYPV